ncbi:MAG: PHP domain-containing protein [Thermomicrobiales bacterium]|nr:PHP domain-containing protein [Thermomicrobiales bacterium]
MSDLRLFYGDYDPEMQLADIHVHTTRSDGWWEPERLAEAAVERGLSAIGITDHDDIAAGDAVANAAARRNLPLRVYIGQEVSARVDDRDVHVLGLDLREEVRPWQSIPATVEAILQQGGFPILPHPRATGRGLPTFDQVLALGIPVAVEIYNGSMLEPSRLWRRGRPDANAEARAFYIANRERLAGAVGGTDAHFRTIGRGLTAYRGDLREAIERRETAVLYRQERERLMPWDPAGYIMGLRRLDRRRSEKYGPRPR